MPLAPPAFVQVVARVRPPADPTTRSGLIVNGAQICLERVDEKADAPAPLVNPPEDARSYEAFVFDCCFDGSRQTGTSSTASLGGPPSSSGGQEEDSEACAAQEEFFQDCGIRFCDDGLNGFDSCLIAYGQRGAGKSHTVMGSRSAPGLVPRVAEHLINQQVPDLTVCLSVMELTPGEELRDLLCATMPGGAAALTGPAALPAQNQQQQQQQEAPRTTSHGPSHARTRSWSGPGATHPEPAAAGGAETSGGRASVPLSLVEHPSLGVYVAGLSEVVCTTAHGVRELLRHSVRERAIAVTSLGGSIQTNTIFMLRLQRGSGSPTWATNRSPGEDAGIPAPAGAKILLADLASSEASPLPYGSPGPKPGRPMPGAVNEGLFNLHMIVRALSDGGRQGKTPFGASKLTQLLKGPLLGNARTTLLAAVSPARADLEESRRTLQFASCVGRIPTSEPQRERPVSEIVVQLKEQVRSLRQQLAVGTADALTSELASWEWVLERQSQAPFRRNATEFEEWSVREVEAVHRRRGLFTEPSLMVEGAPFLSNLSADAQLHGALIFSLRRPPSGTVTVGSHRDCGIILCGVGIPPRLCELTVAAGDEVTLRLLPPFARQQPCRCTVNGGVVRRGSDARIEHGDRLIFGWSHAFQLCAPDRAQRVGLSASLPHFTEDDALRELSPDDSETYSELSLYIEDIREKMNESIAVEFLELLKVACHLVDEANEIMRDMRPDLELKFDVDFVWDIFRRAQDVLLIRVIQQSPSGNNYQESTVQSYWTYAKFGERLAAMRASYNSFVLFGKCGSFGPAVNNPFEDPWMEPSLLDLRHRLHVEKSLVSSEGTYLSGVSSAGAETASTTPAAETSMPATHPHPVRTGRTQGRSGPPRDRASPAIQRRTGPNSVGSARPTGARGTAVGADGAGGPVVAVFEGGGDGSKPRNAPSSRSLSPTGGDRNEEVTHLKSEAQKQAAELRRVKNDLQAAERERKLHEELIESLRAQLTDKTELITTLRALLQDRPSRQDDMQKSGRPSSLERIAAIPRLRLDEMHKDMGRLDDMHKGRPSSLERTRPTTPATADNASVAESTTGSSSHAAGVVHSYVPPQSNSYVPPKTNSYVPPKTPLHPPEEGPRGTKPEDATAFREDPTHSQELHIGHVLGAAVRECNERMDRLEASAKDASQTSSSSMPMVPPRALPMKVVGTGGRPSKGASLDSKSPPFMSWAPEVGSSMVPGSNEVMGSASTWQTASLQTQPQQPSPLKVATVETTDNLIQRHHAETALWAQMAQVAQAASPTVSHVPSTVKSNAGSFTAAPFAMVSQGDRMPITTATTLAPSMSSAVPAQHLRSGSISEMSSQHLRTNSASPPPHRPGVVGVHVMQGGSAVRFASPVPSGGVAPQTAAVSPTNSRLPSPMVAREIHSAQRMDWSSYPPSAQHGPGEAQTLRNQRHPPRGNTIQ